MKRPERERTQEADWMADLICSQLKKDSTGCLEEATEELKQSPEDKVSVGFFFLGVISLIARFSRSAAFQAASVYARSAKSFPLATGAQSKSICLAAKRSQREVWLIWNAHGMGSFPGRSITKAWSLTP